MIFGKIEYLNLLPFHLFLKRHLRHSNLQLSLRSKSGVPSKINRDFAARRIDAAFISSAEAQGRAHVRLGIIAKKSVRSVLVLPSEQFEPDSASATSNALARLLGVQGRILIGDAALRHRLSGGEGIDLAQRWYEREHLPFVFGLLCHHRGGDLLQRLERDFVRRPIRIPYYILKHHAREKGIAPDQVLEYLRLISYTLDAKASRGLHRFWRLQRLSRYQKTQRYM